MVCHIQPQEHMMTSSLLRQSNDDSSCALDNNHNNVLLDLSPGSVSCIFEGQLILAPLEELAMLMLTVYRLNCQNSLQSQTLHATSII